MTAEPHWTYQLRYVRCGKHRCSCATGFGHGPYWYGFRRVGKKVVSKYFGAHPTSQFVDQPESPQVSAVDPRWLFRGRMDGKTALRIMGFVAWPSSNVLSVRWRTLVMEHHPDHGGDVRVCAAINAAYTYLKS